MTRAFRPINLLIIALICVSFQLLSAKITSSSFEFSTKFLVYTINAILIGLSGYILNGHYDRNIDKSNHNGYEFPFSRKQVITIYSAAVVLTILLTLIFLDLLVLFGFVLLPIVLLWLYSSLFKGLPIIGNGIIAFISFWLPVGIFQVNGISDKLGTDIYSQFGMLILGEIFIITFAREVIKDIQDIDGDRKYNCKTVAVRFGENKSAYVASFFLIWASVIWFSTFYKYISELNIPTVVFGVFTLISIIGSIATLWIKRNWQTRTKLSSLILKIGMFTALLTLILI